jgi:biopolymer transport protein ExbD
MILLRARHARRHGRSEELNLTTFINLMVVLVSFLMATAVYSRIAVHELNLPSAAAPPEGPPPLNLTVIVRESGFTLSDRSGVLSMLPLQDGKFDYAALGDLLRSVKTRVPQERTVTLRLEPKVSYDVIVQVMDAVRLPAGGGEGFPDIAIGDAPQVATP